MRFLQVLLRNDILCFSFLPNFLVRDDDDEEETARF